MGKPTQVALRYISAVEGQRDGKREVCTVEKVLLNLYRADLGGKVPKCLSERMWLKVSPPSPIRWSGVRHRVFPKDKPVTP